MSACFIYFVIFMIYDLRFMYHDTIVPCNSIIDSGAGYAAIGADYNIDIVYNKDIAGYPDIGLSRYAAIRLSCQP